MRRTTLPVAMGALLLATAALAQPSPGLADFPKSPAGFLMTPSEQKAFAELKSDAAAQAFIDLFWAKRDPNQETVFNEAKADFEARVTAADKQFCPGTPPGQLKDEKGCPGVGSLQDRARVFYIMGIPSAPIEGKAALPIDVDADAPAAMRKGATQIWKYAKNQPPKGKDDFVTFYFTESRPDVGDYLLDPKDKRNREALKVLAERQEKLVLHPKLTEVPRMGLITGTKAASPAQLAVLATEPKPWPEGAMVFTVSGVQSENVHPIWLHLELPDAVAPAKEAVGRVTGKDGAEVGTFFMTLTPMSMAGARGYQFSIPLDPGDYKVELALLGEAGPLAVHTFDATSEALANDTTYISPMYPGVDPRQEPGFKMGDPFNVGGWHLIPRPSNRFSTLEQVTYFCYVSNPGKDEAGNPKFELGFKLVVDGKPAGERPPVPVTLSAISDRLFMFGSGLPLSAFTRPAEYKLVLTLLDKVTKVSRTSEVVVVIPGAPAAPPAPKP